MRQCATCAEIKSESEYNWRNKLRGKRWGTCRDCQRKQQANWYENNKERHKTNMYQKKLNKRDEGREYVWSYLLKNPCVRCGESDPQVLEFHHVDKKRSSVTGLVRNGYSLEIIQKEISRCIVLCANCHKKETYRGSWRDQ